MKRLLNIAAFVCMTMLAFGQTPVITFQKTTHDFGKINEADGRVTPVFEFKNEGMTPLVLSNVRASCGCPNASIVIHTNAAIFNNRFIL